MDADTILEYLRLVVRTNGISMAYLDGEEFDTTLLEALSNTTHLAGRTLEPIHVQML